MTEQEFAWPKPLTPLTLSDVNKLAFQKKQENRVNREIAIINETERIFAAVKEALISSPSTGGPYYITDEKFTRDDRVLIAIGVTDKLGGKQTLTHTPYLSNTDFNVVCGVPEDKAKDPYVVVKLNALGD